MLIDFLSLGASPTWGEAFREHDWYLYGKALGQSLAIYSRFLQPVTMCEAQKRDGSVGLHPALPGQRYCRHHGGKL